MANRHMGAVEGVEGSIVAALTWTGDSVRVTADSVSRTRSTTVDGAGKAGASLAEAVGGELELPATGSVEGAIHSAKSIGLSAEGTADKVGFATGQRVRRALTHMISGVKVVLRTPFKGNE